MFLSKLVLDPTNPQARRDLGNAYEMHRTLSRVYAGSPDSPPARFLWRLEHSGDRSPEEDATILLQSATVGCWQHLQEVPGYVRILYPDKSVPLEQLLETGRRYVFRLGCNPTVTRAGKRYGLVREEEQLAWLARQGHLHGFIPLHARISRSERISLRRGRNHQYITLQMVQFDGLLQAVDSERLAQALVRGIGHAKALGLGMLSLAPVDRCLALQLFDAGTLTLAQAAKFSGVGVEAFIERAGAAGVTVVRTAPEDLEAELNVIARHGRSR